MSQDGRSDDGAYNNGHRAFLQAFVSHATLTFDQAKPILAAVLSAQDGREIRPDDVALGDLQNLVADLNARVSPLDLEIRSTLSQHSKTRIWALVNTTSDPITQLATVHTPDEMAYLKRLLDHMFDKNNTRAKELCAVSDDKAYNLAKPGRDERERAERDGGPQSQPLNMMQAQRMLANLVQDGWFECSANEYYSLGPRALMELRGWLIDTYNDDDGDVKIRFCAACRDIVTVGERCPDLDCGGRLHLHCTRNAFRAENAERCPVCKKDWVEPLPVGEKASSASARRASRRSQMDGADGSEEEESDEG